MLCKKTLLVIKKSQGVQASDKSFLSPRGYGDVSLGLVPRDLEEVWPAGHYDIPVTGDWTLDERKRVTSTRFTY